MRLWSLHLKHLDRRGLVALWREALLAQAVLQGKTTGYRHHPQLLRFRDQRDPVAAIGAYLSTIHAEAASRGYHFNGRKIAIPRARIRMRVAKGQLAYEYSHLRSKLRRRDPERYRLIEGIRRITPNPLFNVVPGEAEPWEKHPVS